MMKSKCMGQKKKKKRFKLRNTKRLASRATDYKEGKKGSGFSQGGKDKERDRKRESNSKILETEIFYVYNLKHIGRHSNYRVNVAYFCLPKFIFEV